MLTFTSLWSILLDMKRDGVKVLFVEVPIREHMRIKQLAAGMGISMQMFVRKAVRHYVQCPDVRAEEKRKQ